MTGIRRETLNGPIVIDHESFADSRGFFKYAFQMSDLDEIKTKAYEVRQVNHSFSSKGVLRGIHYEPWGKIIYVPSGKAEICVVNLRPGDEEFADYFLVTIGDFDGGRNAVYVPQGFGNAFYCLEDTHYLNLVSKEFEEKGRGGLRWDDPVLSVDWSHKDNPILSSQDMNWPPIEHQFPEAFEVADLDG